MTIHEHIARSNSVGNKVIPHVICEDGFTMSVQVGDRAYSTPREYGAESYDCVEIGFPSQEESLIRFWAEDHNDYTNTVYPYVPINIVEQVIEKHGGIVG